MSDSSILRRFAPICTSLSLLLVSASSGALAAPVARFGLSPDNDLTVLVSTLATAKTQIDINMYQFDSAPVADQLIERIKAGVSVRLLLESHPVEGSISAQEKQMLHRIQDAMKASGVTTHRIFMMGALNGVNKSRRYAYDHAKYVLIDGIRVLICSENFTATGHPAPGQIGNRGWEVVLEDPSLVSTMTDMFNVDSDTQYKDVTAYGPRDPLPFAPEAVVSSEIVGFSSASGPRHNPALPEGFGTFNTATLITSPNSLNGLQDFMRFATKTLDTEQMSLPHLWKVATIPGPSPLVSELIAAAKRGVAVRALLNDDNVFDFSSDPTKKTNTLTVKYLTDMARCYGLPIAARIINIKQVGITYIHNKGILADSQRVLISSINGTRNSVMNNREVAVALDSPDAAAYFGRAYDKDWELSAADVELKQPTGDCPSYETDSLMPATAWSRPDLGWL